MKTATGRSFPGIRELFAELGRPTAEALNALLPAPDDTGEPPASYVPPQLGDVATPRVVEWVCTPPLEPSAKHPDQTCILALFVVPPDGHEIELWSTKMRPEDEPEVRAQLAELAEENLALWTGATPGPSEVAALVDRVVGSITEASLAATGLGTEQAVDAYLPVRAAALQGVMALLAHADEQGWTGPQMAQAWREYVHDVDPVQH